MKESGPWRGGCNGSTYLSAEESKSANRGAWLSVEWEASGPASGSSVVVAVNAVAVKVCAVSSFPYSVPSSPLSVDSSPESGEAGPLCVTLPAAVVFVFFALIFLKKKERIPISHPQQSPTCQKRN